LFFTLIGAALFYGLVAGMSPDTVFLAMLAGLGRVFAAFAIIILCGAVIGKTLHEQGQIQDLVSDLNRRVKSPRGLAGLSGYIFALPTTCCITAFVMLTPILESLGKSGKGSRDLLYLAAAGSVISYTLVYPTPVTIPLVNTLGNDLSPLAFDLVALPVSLIVLGALVAAFRLRNAGTGIGDDAAPGAVREEDKGIHWRAWAPFIAVVLAIPVGALVFHLSHGSLIQAIMLAGAATAAALAAPAARVAGLQQGTRHAGVIMFDICGAGALGEVIVQSGFAGSALPLITAAIPLVLVPFVITALIQAAQGSRVVTAVIAAQVLGGTAIASALHPLPLLLSVAAGTCVVSYVTDPYFWLLERTTGERLANVVRSYTLPLAAAGLAILLVAVGLSLLLPTAPL
jgi:GntP family gluconate:H+ symporter